MLIFYLCLVGAQTSSTLPPPPWEVQLDNSQGTISQPPQIQVGHSQALPDGTYLPGSPNVPHYPAPGLYNGIHLSPIGNQSNQMVGNYPQSQTMAMYPQPMQSGHMGGYVYPQQMYGNNQMAGYGYGYGYGYAQGQQQNTQFLQQSMSGLSIRDDMALRNSISASSSYVPPPSGKPSKPEDKLFGDLVDITKFKPAKTNPGRAGSM